MTKSATLIIRIDFTNARKTVLLLWLFYGSRKSQVSRTPIDIDFFNIEAYKL